MMHFLYDIFIIGGGVNGIGIAADASGRGLKVLLCEQNDLASGTSSASSKLIHGGLRYLEQYDLSLVRGSLKERHTLQRVAPHLIQPLRFIVPYRQDRRPFWLIRLGLFTYDFIGFPALAPRSKVIHFQQVHHNPLVSSIQKGFVYSDCIVDDARLVVLNALQAKRHGATILTRVKCISAVRMQDHWEITLENKHTKEILKVKAKAVINATGPWINQIIENNLKIHSNYRTRLVKGSHIVVPKMYDHPQAYLLQHQDNRVIFVIPYEHQFTLIGTTDVAYDGDPEKASIDDTEINYLCEIVNSYFSTKITPHHIISTWSGVRSLMDESKSSLSTLQRGYKIEVLTNEHHALPLVNIFGGKLTTYRQLSEKTLNSLSHYFPHCGDPWTAKAFLPGQELREHLFGLFPWLPPKVAARYQQHYGSLAMTFLRNVHSFTDLGQDFGYGLYEQEVKYLLEQEWAKTAEDVLWRRSKLGLLFSKEQTQKLSDWIQEQVMTKQVGHP